MKFDQITTRTGLRHWSNIFENFTSPHLYLKTTASERNLCKKTQITKIICYISHKSLQVW
jgi:hypothetical protein